MANCGSGNDSWLRPPRPDKRPLERAPKVAAELFTSSVPYQALRHSGGHVRRGGMRRVASSGLAMAPRKPAAVTLLEPVPAFRTSPIFFTERDGNAILDRQLSRVRDRPPPGSAIQLQGSPLAGVGRHEQRPQLGHPVSYDPYGALPSHPLGHHRGWHGRELL